MCGGSGCWGLTNVYSVGLLKTHLLNVHPDSQEFSCVIAINTFLMTDVVLTVWKWLSEI